MIDPIFFLSFSALLFTMGMLGVLTQKNAMRILMSVELMFNAANLNLVLFASYSGASLPDFEGWLLALIAIAVAAAEAAIGIAIFMSLSRSWGQINIKNIFSLGEDHPTEIL